MNDIELVVICFAGFIFSLSSGYFYIMYILVQGRSVQIHPREVIHPI
jgi:hypothetical protein